MRGQYAAMAPFDTPLRVGLPQPSLGQAQDAGSGAYL
jgi:hypothetical protein